MVRAKQCLALFFEVDRTAEDRVGVLEAFGKALRFQPKWAVSQAFDEWERTMTHRPSPANIVKLANDAVKPLHAEIRRREAATILDEPKEPPASPEARARILAEAGFTPRRVQAVLSGRRTAGPKDVDARLSAEERS